MTVAVSRTMLNVRALFGRSYPRVIGMQREPSWIFFETVLPLLGIAAYVFIYRGFFDGALNSPNAAVRTAALETLNAMVGFVVLGGTMIAFWLNVLWSMASQLYWEKEMGNLQLYMMEAEMLCDRIAIINKGQILACDTPENLKRRIKQDSTFRIEVDALKDMDGFAAIPGVRNFSAANDIAKNTTRLTFILSDESAVSDIMSRVMGQGSRIQSLQKSDPTLEDVFVAMCGRGLE